MQASRPLLRPPRSGFGPCRLRKSKDAVELEAHHYITHAHRVHVLHKLSMSGIPPRLNSRQLNLQRIFDDWKTICAEVHRSYFTIRLHAAKHTHIHTYAHTQTHIHIHTHMIAYCSKRTMPGRQIGVGVSGFYSEDA